MGHGDNIILMQGGNMKLYLSIKKMNFEEDDIEHNIINKIEDKEFSGYDEIIELSKDDKLIKDILKITYKKDNDGKETKEIEDKIFLVKEQKTWWNFPLYELRDGKIIDFDYTKYNYFVNTDRRNALANKINNLYNPPSEAKIIRKTIKFILDELKLKYPDDFSIMDKKIEEIIRKNPKDIIK